MSRRTILSVVLLAAALVAAFVLLAVRAVRATRLEAESQVRERLRATASEAAARADARFSSWLDEELASDRAFRLGEAGRFEHPAEPVPFVKPVAPLDAPDDLAFFLREGERSEAGDPDAARGFYLAAARPEAPPGLRRIALARLAALESRRGNEEEARRHWESVVPLAGDTDLLLTAAAEGAPVPAERVVSGLVRHLAGDPFGHAEGYARLLGLGDHPALLARAADLDAMAMLRARAHPPPAAGTVRFHSLLPDLFAFQRERRIALVRRQELRGILGPTAVLRADPVESETVEETAVGAGPLVSFRFRAVAEPGELDRAVRRQAVVLFGAAGLAGAAAIVGLLFLLKGVRREAQLARLKSDFVANASHELRTPLARIRLYAESLRTGRVPDEEVSDYVQVVEREAAALTRLVDRVLDFARIERGTKEYRREPGDLVELVRTIAAGARMEELEIDVPENPVRARFDEAALGGAVTNLLDNAAKHGGGEATLRLARLANGAARVEVADRGPGVPAEEAGRIFDRFHRGRAALRDAVRGSGLGLTLVRHAAEGHGGEAGYAPRSGSGSVFWFTVSTEDGA